MVDRYELTCGERDEYMDAVEAAVNDTRRLRAVVDRAKAMLRNWSPEYVAELDAMLARAEQSRDGVGTVVSQGALGAVPDVSCLKAGPAEVVATGEDAPPAAHRASLPASVQHTKE